MFENPRRGKQARNFTTNVSKILDLKSSSEQIFFRKLSLGAPDNSSLVFSRLGSALVKAAYNIACSQLNGDTLISLYAVLLMLERVWTLLPQF